MIVSKRVLANLEPIRSFTLLCSARVTPCAIAPGVDSLRLPAMLQTAL